MAIGLSGRYRQGETMNSFVRRGLAASFILVVVLVAMLIRGRSADSVEENTATGLRYLPVATLEAKEVDRYHVTKTYTGEIVARRTSDLGFERNGRIESVLVREGSTVSKGDAVALMDTRRLEQRLRELSATETEADAVLDELLAGPRSQELRVAVERVNELKAELRYARSNRERAAHLLEEEVGTVDDLERTRAREHQLSAALAASEQSLDEMNEGSRREQIQAQQARVEQLAARRALLRIEIEDSTMRAPYDGRIAARYADEGSVMASGAPVVRIVEDGAPTAWIGRPRDLGLEMQIGQAAAVRSNGKEYRGIVAAILPQLHETTRTTTVVIDLEAVSPGELASGQIVSFDIEREVQGRGFWLPSSALVRGTRGLWACLAVSEIREETNESGESITIGLLQRRDVEVLHATESRVVVRGMLSDGEQILGVGTHRVVRGQWVELIGV